MSRAPPTPPPPNLSVFLSSLRDLELLSFLKCFIQLFVNVAGSAPSFTPTTPDFVKPPKFSCVLQLYIPHPPPPQFRPVRVILESAASLWVSSSALQPHSFELQSVPAAETQNNEGLSRAGHAGKLHICAWACVCVAMHTHTCEASHEHGSPRLDDVTHPVSLLSFLVLFISGCFLIQLGDPGFSCKLTHVAVDADSGMLTVLSKGKVTALALTVVTVQ